MKLEEVQNKKEEGIKQEKSNDPLESLTSEEKSWFERKFEAQKYFKGKIDNLEASSTESSQNGIATLDRRMGDLNDPANPERDNQETSMVKVLLSNIANQKQEAIRSGDEKMQERLVELEKTVQAIAERQGENAGKENSSQEAVEKNDNVKISNQPDITNKIKPGGEQQEGAETVEAEKLMPGDEVFSNGDFYKVYDIYTPTPEAVEKEWQSTKIARDKEFEAETAHLPFKEGSDNRFKEKEKFDAEMRKKIESRRTVKAIIKGGEQMVELTEENAIKIKTPEQREKIVKMQKEEDGAEQRAADYMGMGATKKAVDKITGQPGKF